MNLECSLYHLSNFEDLRETDIDAPQRRYMKKQSSRDELNHELFHIGDLLDIIICYSEPPQEHVYLMNEIDIMYREWQFCHAQFDFAKWYLSVYRYFRNLSDSFDGNY